MQGCEDNVFSKCIFLKCFYPKCIFAKCTRLACLLSFASLFPWNAHANKIEIQKPGKIFRIKQIYIFKFSFQPCVRLHCEEHHQSLLLHLLYICCETDRDPDADDGGNMSVTIGFLIGGTLSPGGILSSGGILSWAYSQR